jgi:hypothetical protein
LADDDAGFAAVKLGLGAQREREVFGDLQERREEGSPLGRSTSGVVPCLVGGNTRRTRRPDAKLMGGIGGAAVSQDRRKTKAAGQKKKKPDAQEGSELGGRRTTRVAGRFFLLIKQRGRDEGKKRVVLFSLAVFFLPAHLLSPDQGSQVVIWPLYVRSCTYICD